MLLTILFSIDTEDARTEGRKDNVQFLVLPGSKQAFAAAILATVDRFWKSTQFLTTEKWKHENRTKIEGDIKGDSRRGSALNLYN